MVTANRALCLQQQARENDASCGAFCSQQQECRTDGHGLVVLLHEDEQSKSSTRAAQEQHKSRRRALPRWSQRSVCRSRKTREHNAGAAPAVTVWLLSSMNTSSTRAAQEQQERRTGGHGLVALLHEHEQHKRSTRAGGESCTRAAQEQHKSSTTAGGESRRREQAARAAAPAVTVWLFSSMNTSSDLATETTAWWLSMTPLGSPVVPLVYMMVHRSAGAGGSAGTSMAAPADDECVVSLSAWVLL